MPDEVARIGALSNGSNGQRSLESASLHFERHCAEPAREILSDPKLAEGESKDLFFEAIWRRELGNAEREPTAEILSVSEGYTLLNAALRDPRTQNPESKVKDLSTGIAALWHYC